MDGIGSALSGLQTAGQGVALSAGNVANINTPGYRARSLVQEDQAQGGVRGAAVVQSQAAAAPGASNVDPGAEAVNLNTQGAGYQADLKFLQVQEKMLGSALDLKA